MTNKRIRPIKIFSRQTRFISIFQETTARLLFMAVRWVRCIPPFQTLSKNDQLLLLEASWTQLFLLHLAQWSISWNINRLLDDEQIRARLPTDEATTNQELAIIQVTQPNTCKNSDGQARGKEIRCIILHEPSTAIKFLGKLFHCSFLPHMLRVIRLNREICFYMLDKDLEPATIDAK